MDALIKNGQKTPEFELPDLEGNLFSLDSAAGWIRVLNFWSAECTWCERVDDKLMAYAEKWRGRVKVIWIAANANEPPEFIKRVAKERGISPVLLDKQQEVADRYGAQTTPHFFIIDAVGDLAYQGAWDDITFRNRVATKIYVPQVVEALGQGRVPEITQTPPYGCVLVRFSDPGG